MNAYGWTYLLGGLVAFVIAVNIAYLHFREDSITGDWEAVVIAMTVGLIAGLGWPIMLGGIALAPSRLHIRRQEKLRLRAKDLDARERKIHRLERELGIGESLDG